MKILCGNKLREYRTISGLSQREVAEKIGVSKQAVSSWEMNRTEPNMGQLTKMCRVYGCEITDIIESSSNDRDSDIIKAYRNADMQTKRIVLYALHLEEYL